MNRRRKKTISINAICVESLLYKHVSDTLAREEKMENRSEGKSDGSRKIAATKCFLLVLFLLEIDRQCRQKKRTRRRWRRKRKKRKTERKKNEDEDDDDEEDGGGGVVVMVRRSRVLRTTVRMSTMKHCRRSMMLLTHSTFYLMTC